MEMQAAARKILAHAAGISRFTVGAKIQARPAGNCVACSSGGTIAHSGLKDKLFGVDGSWNFRRCANPDCGLVWMDPMPLPDELPKAYKSYYTHAGAPEAAEESFLKRLYHQIKESYIAEKYGYSRGGAKTIARVFGKLLYLFPLRRADVDAAARWLDAVPGGRLLDVGCGSGEWLASMSNLGWTVEGVDFDEQAVEAARRRGVRAAHGTLEEQRFTAGSFDVVTVNHVIEHVPDPSSLLKECRRVIKPGGRLVVATPNCKSFGHAIFKENWRGLEPPRHLQILSPLALRRYLSEAGFKQVRIMTVNSYYVIYHSYALLRSRKPNSVMPRVLAMLESLLLEFKASMGECIVGIAMQG
jgi:2-polyprenyl-3-methyl-5-hydroxy-6-metoxy-1,4-benzoquinol methylase